MSTPQPTIFKFAGEETSRTGARITELGPAQLAAARKRILGVDGQDRTDRQKREARRGGRALWQAAPRPHQVRQVHRRQRLQRTESEHLLVLEPERSSRCHDNPDRPTEQGIPDQPSPPITRVRVIEDQEVTVLDDAVRLEVQARCAE